MTTDEINRVQDHINQMELESRKDEFKFRRYYLMKYLRKGSTMSLTTIGKMFSKDHATVMNALKKVDVLENYTDYQIHTNDLAIEFPLEGLLTNSVNNVSSSMQQLEGYLFLKNPSLTR